MLSYSIELAGAGPVKRSVLQKSYCNCHMPCTFSWRNQSPWTTKLCDHPTLSPIFVSKQELLLFNSLHMLNCNYLCKDMLSTTIVGEWSHNNYVILVAMHIICVLYANSEGTMRRLYLFEGKHSTFVRFPSGTCTCIPWWGTLSPLYSYDTLKSLFLATTYFSYISE